MTGKDNKTLMVAFNYMSGMKPKRVPDAVSRMARLAKTQGLSDDARMILWVVRYRLTEDDPLGALAIASRALGFNGKGA